VSNQLSEAATPHARPNDVELVLQTANELACKLVEKSNALWETGVSVRLSVDAQIGIHALCIPYRRKPGTIRKAFAEMVEAQLKKEFNFKNPKVRCGHFRVHVKL
jgi:hypothetical protein